MSRSEAASVLVLPSPFFSDSDTIRLLEPADCDSQAVLRKVVSGEYDSAFSAEKIQTFAWYEGRPLNYSPENIPRTQTIEPVYIETSAFFIFPRALWTGRHRRIGDRPYMAVVDRIEGLDIDYPEDFTMAEIIAASRNLPK